MQQLDDQGKRKNRLCTRLDDQGKGKFVYLACFSYWCWSVMYYCLPVSQRGFQKQHHCTCMFCVVLLNLKSALFLNLIFWVFDLESFFKRQAVSFVSDFFFIQQELKFGTRLLSDPAWTETAPGYLVIQHGLRLHQVT